MKWISFFCLTSVLFLTSAFRVFDNRVIYGDDNRADLYQVSDSAIQKIARSTAAMIKIKNLQKIETLYKITSGQFGQEFKLCQSEPFYSQPNGAFCSAFLVAPDMVATAGHCVNSMDCSTVAFVFDYAMKSETVAPTEASVDDVYFCKSVVQRELTTKQDYSLVQLDRPVTGRDPLKLASTPPQVNDEVFVVGHPSGLPTKVAGGAAVRSQKAEFFTSNLDTYGGNSGSAVLSSKTLEVEGILVRGEADFIYDSGKACYQSNHCANDSCRGEDATNIGFIAKALNTTYLE